MNLAQSGSGTFQELPDVIPEEWYYRQAEGPAADALQPLSMHDHTVTESAEDTYPLSGTSLPFSYVNSPDSEAQGWQNEASRDGKLNHDRHVLERDLFSSVEKAEDWFASLDEKKTETEAKVDGIRPELNALEAAGCGVDAWDAWTGFTSGEMHWFLECSNLAVSSCPGQTHTAHVSQQSAER